ncbi:MAG TPA: WG repeat-containing protein [Planctomycetota bacterium]|nr:WG repeat-containing protein [Planctomycetota bacterium]
MKSAIVIALCALATLNLRAEDRRIFTFNTIDGAYVHSKWGFIDQMGKVVVEAKYTAVGDFSEGLAAVKTGGTHFIGGKSGFIDRTGVEVIEPQFEGARSFSEGLAAVRVKGKWGFIGRDGKLRIEPQFESVNAFHEGLALFTRDKKYGYIDRTGAVVIEPQFQWTAGFSEGLAPVQLPAEDGADGLSGYINIKGEMEIVLLPPYTSSLGFSEGVAYVRDANGKYALIDRDGEIVAAPDYTVNWPGAFRDGLAEVRIVTADRDEEWGVIDKTGAIVVPFKLSYSMGIRYLEEDGSLHGIHFSMKDEFSSEPLDLTRVHTRRGLIRIWSGGERPLIGTMKYGFMDPAGKVIIKPQFEDVRDFHEGLAMFAVGLEWGNMNLRE